MPPRAKKAERRKREGLVRALLAVAGDVAVYQLRELCLQALIVQTLFFQGLFPDVGDENIGGSDELQKGFQALGGLGVQADAPLVGVVQVETGVLVVAQGAALVDGGAPEGVAAGGLHFDDVRAQVGQVAGAGGSGHKGGHLNDFDALQGAGELGHGDTSLQSRKLELPVKARAKSGNNPHQECAQPYISSLTVEIGVAASTDNHTHRHAP